MFMSLAKIRYAMTAVALIIISLIIAFVYTRPTDVYGLDSGIEVDTIQITLFRNEGSTAQSDLEKRAVSFQRGQEGFDEALAKVEALEFQRPFKNLLPQFEFLKNDSKRGEIDGHDYEFYIHLSTEGSETAALTLSCWLDNWEYRKDTYDTDYPLKATANTESSRSFGDYFWELAAESEN